MVTCPFCGNPSNFYIQVFEENHFSCQQCRLIFPYPYPDQEEMIRRHLSEDYSNHSYFQTGEQLALQGELNFHQTLLEKLKFYLAPQSRILDIGAGTGDFVALASTFFRVACIEPSPQLAQRIKDKIDCPVFVGSLEDYRLEEPFDAVICLDVIEHFADPRNMLEKVRSILQPGGYAVVSTIDSRSILYLLAPLIWRLFGHLSKAKYLLQRIFCYQHNWYFNAAVLRDLMVEMHYEIVEQEGFEFPLGRLKESPVILWGLRGLYLINALLRMKTEQFIIVKKHES